MELFLKGLNRGIRLFTIMLIIGLWKNFRTPATDLKSYFLTSLIVFFLGAASVIYEIESLSFLRQILAHYLVMLVTVFPVLLLSGSYPLNSIGDLLQVFLLFNRTGIVLFVSTFLLLRAFSRFVNRSG